MSKLMPCAGLNNLPCDKACDIVISMHFDVHIMQVQLFSLSFYVMKLSRFWPYFDFMKANYKIVLRGKWIWDYKSNIFVQH